MDKYKVKGLPWSCGLGKDVTDCDNSIDVMKKAGLDFTVSKCELVAKMPFSINGNNKIENSNDGFTYKGNIYRSCDNAYATYRTDLNVPLGLVKSKYNVIQNIEAFRFFDDAIGEGKAQWQSAGYFGLGHKIFVTAKLPIDIKVGKDEVKNYLVFSNSHDGSSSINILFTPIRVACTNMLNSALKQADSYIRIRHTQTAKEKLERGKEVLRIACQHAKDAEQLYNSLLTINMNDEEVKRYLANLVLTDAERQELINYDKTNGYKKLFEKNYLTLERTKISMRKANQIISMWNYYNEGIGQKEIAGTAWGAYNAVTGYYSNVANLEGEKRMDSLCYGTANRFMNEAIISAYDIQKIAV